MSGEDNIWDIRCLKFMPVSRSAGIIFFRNTPKGRVYLMLRASHKVLEHPEFWDFPKGELEKGETGLQAAEREAKEEAGISEFEMIPDFKETAHYFTVRDGKRVPKFVAMFLARTGTEHVTLSWEHDTYAWLSYQDVFERISLKPMKEVLEKAEEFLGKSNA